MPISPSLPICDGCLQATGAAERSGLGGPHRRVLASRRPRPTTGERKRFAGGGGRFTRKRNEKEVRKDGCASGVSVPAVRAVGRVRPVAVCRQQVSRRHGGDR